MSTSRYLVRYLVLPPGVGPDDYESGDLERREEVHELPDGDGGTIAVGPLHSEVEAALSTRLAEGERPIILSVRVPQD